MAIQYPTYRADTDAIPKLNGIPGFIDSVEKGYKLAQMPEQMKQEALLRRSQAQKAQVEAQYADQEAQQRIAASQANTQYAQAQTGYENKRTSRYDDEINNAIQRNNILNANTMASTSLTNTQAAAAQDDLTQQRAFYARLQQLRDAAQNGQGAPQGGGNMPPPSAQGGPQPQYQPGQGAAPFMQAPPQQQQPQMNAPQAALQGAPQPGPQVGPQGAMQGSQSGGVSPIRVLNPGNPSSGYLDELASDPGYAAQLAKLKIPGIKTENKFDKDGNLQVLTTYPSGKTTIESVQLQDPAVQAQQAQSAELNKKIADQQALKYGDYTKELGSAIKIQGDIESLANAINVPEFDNAVGPVNNFFHKNLGLGDDETKKLFGTINSTTGLIQGEMANSISGNAAKAKLYFAQMIKPSASDPAAVFRGKLEAINAANKWNVDYNSYVAKAIRSGVPTDQAIVEADKAIPWSKYQGQMASFLKNGELASKYQGQGLKVSYQDSGSGDHHPYVDVRTPDGGTLSVPVEKYQVYLDKMKGSKNG